MSCRMLTVTLICAALALPAQATTLLRSQELPELVDESRRAVLATVTGVRHGFDERGLHSTFVDLRVDDRLYGNAPRAGEPMAIKLYGAPEVLEDGTRVFVDGTPEYEMGGQYLLLLLDDSPWGFTNATGLNQGAFRVKARGGDGRMAESLAGNRGVLREGGLARFIDPEQMSPSDRRFARRSDGPVPYTLLRQTVVELKHRRGDR